MILFFEIPEILDSTSIASLARPEAKGNPTDQQFLKEVDSLRNQYKIFMNKDKVVEAIFTSGGLSNFKVTFDKYLQTNADVLAIVGRQPFNAPNFRYKTFISRKQKDYVTSIISNIEACAAEIMMVRYSYAFCFMLNAMPHLTLFYNNIGSSFKEPAQFPDRDKLLSEISLSIENFQTGIQPIHRLSKRINDVQYFLISNQGLIIPELRSLVFDAIKLILECNINGLHQEKLRIEEEYYILSQICKATYNKLNTVHSRFSSIQAEIRQDILSFVEVSLIFSKTYALWAQLQIHLRDIAKDNFAKYSFTQLSLETVAISSAIKDHGIPAYKAKYQNADYYDFGLSILTQVILPVCEKSIILHSVIKHLQTLPRNAEQIFSDIEAKDYFIHQNGII